MNIEITDTFHFKKFSIAQNQKVFRVNTDSVLLVSWIESLYGKRILEIGSGTGLISIALDSKFHHANQIICLDIDKNAYDLTSYNIRSNATTNIEARHMSFQEFALHCDNKFDVLVSNPPFYNNSFKSKKDKNLFAKYTDALSFEDLIHFSLQVLSESGSIFMVLPYSVLDEINVLGLKNSYGINAIATIFPKIDKTPNRVLIQMSKNYSIAKLTSLVIRDSDNKYTDEYKQFTSEFYIGFK